VEKSKEKTEAGVRHRKGGKNPNSTTPIHELNALVNLRGMPRGKINQGKRIGQFGQFLLNSKATKKAKRVNRKPAINTPNPQGAQVGGVSVLMFCSQPQVPGQDGAFV